MTRFALGLTGELTHDIVRSDTAAAWGNEIEVLATPVLLWLAEMACVRALEVELSPTEMTLGAEHAVGHLAPTPNGFSVKVKATLTKVEDRQLTFAVSAFDGIDTVLSGTHVRYLVDKARFLAKVQKKAGQQNLPNRGVTIAEPDHR